jgi:hypothetical protein
MKYKKLSKIIGKKRIFSKADTFILKTQSPVPRLIDSQFILFVTLKLMIKMCREFTPLSLAQSAL